jgi:hypothetical protein
MKKAINFQEILLQAQSGTLSIAPPTTKALQKIFL